MGAREEKLINYMMKHRHGSPFEHTYFTFHVKAPLFVVREWQRHRIGSYNEMSGRYVEFEPEFYYPARWRVPADSNKQGSVFPDVDHDRIIWDNTNDTDYEEAMIMAWGQYQLLLEAGVAKEMARMVLPLSLYTQFYWTVNARSLMNFMNLRLGADAQWEIRQYAVELKEFFKEKMPITHEAWINNGYLAP
jgi:thymidylate synthase (FAD)